MEPIGGLTTSVLAIVSGLVPYLAYKNIGVIAGVIDKYGTRNDMKLFTVKTILEAQVGGIVLFFGCYIIAVGFAAALLLDGWKDHFPCFLIFGGLVASAGIVIMIWKLFDKSSFYELIERQHKTITVMKDNNGNIIEKTEQTLPR